MAKKNSGTKNNLDKSQLIEGLSAKESAFVQHFINNGFNATKSYKAAGYSPKTQASATSAASRLLSKVNIQKAIKELMFHEEQKLADDYEVSKDRIRRELALVGFSNMRKLARWEENKVTLIDSEEMDDDQAAPIKSIKYSQSSSSGMNGDSSSESFTFSTHDKVKALELLGKSVGLFDGSDDEGEDTENLKGIEDEVSRTIEKL